MRRALRSVASLLLVALAPLALDGCVSVGLSRSALERPDTTGTVRVAIYETPGARDAGALSPQPVFSELLRVGARGETSVARSMAPAWEISDLSPGRYRLRVTKRIDERGDIEELSQPGSKAFDLRAGETVTADVVLKKTPVIWIVLAAITVVVLVILSIDWLKKAKLPPPPPLPRPGPLPVYIATEFSFTSALGGRGPAPASVDVFPAEASVVAARRVTVNFLVSPPLDPEGIEAGAVLALGSVSGEIPGVVSYREAEQLVRFTPSRDFAPGETVTVTLDLAKVESRGGARGDGKASTHFTVPGRS